MAKRRSEAPAKISSESKLTNANKEDSVLVGVEQARERWNEYVLEDGTVLKVRAVLVDVHRSKNKHTPDGNPLYHLKTALVTDVNAPASLKKR